MPMGSGLFKAQIRSLIILAFTYQKLLDYCLYFTAKKTGTQNIWVPELENHLN